LNKRETITRSFRISKAAFNALNEEAERQNISVNTLVNQLFLSYTNFDRFAKKLRMIKLSTPTFKRVLETSSEEAIIGAGHAAGSNVPEIFILAKDGVLTLETILDYLKSLSNYANLFEYNEVVRDNDRTITLAHELGPKGSLFIAHYIQSLFERIKKQPVFSLSDDAIVLELLA
jgi:predicted DNA-binding ribbon-helix-helix protein